MCCFLLNEFLSDYIMITFFHFAVSFVCFQATTETEEAVVDYAMY